MDLCIEVLFQPLFLCQSRVSFLLHHEFMDLLVQPVSDLFLSWILVIRHHTSLMQIQVLETEPFVGLLGSDPGLALISQTNPYTTNLFGISHGARTEVSPKAIWGDAGTKFPHPEMVVMSVYSFYSYFCAGHLVIGLARLALYSTL